MEWPIQHSANLFDWDCHYKVASAEESTLRANCPDNVTFCHIIRDIGFGVHNPRTGCSTTWMLNKEMHNRDGDVTYWELVPTPATIAACPKLENWRIKVFND